MLPLKNICMSAVLHKYSLFRSNLRILPASLIEDLEKEKFSREFEYIDGKYYRKQAITNAQYSDWGNYKS